MTAARPATVVVASDAFKGSSTSLEVADAVRLGMLDVAPGARVITVPVADGGEGTVAAALASGWAAVPVRVHGPTGEPVTATMAIWPPAEGVFARLGTAAPHHSTADSTAAPHHSTADSTAAPHHSTADSTAAPHHSTADSTAAPQASSADTGDTTILGGAAGRRVALVEMADACGLGRLPSGVTAPLTASSRGLGEAVLAALDLGAQEVVIGVGGSASTDGGAGMLAALGARVLDTDGRDLPAGGAALTRVASLDLIALDPRLARTRLVLAADVDSPMLGPTGAAAVFGPQKGATPDDVDLLEAALARWAAVVENTLPGTRSTNRSKMPHPHVPTSTKRSRPGQPGAAPRVTTSTSWSTAGRMPGAGAAGGVGFALLSVLGAHRRSGVEVVLDLVGLDAALADPDAPVDLVVTGEGSLDAQTLTGKAVTGVARRAAAHGIPVVAVCGRLTLDEGEVAALGVRTAYPLSDLEPDVERSVAQAAALLRRTGQRIARDWLSPARA